MEEHINWYHLVTAAPGSSQMPYAVVNGDFFEVYNSFNVRDQLKNLNVGFRFYPPRNNSWYTYNSKVDNGTLQQIENLGVNTDRVRGVVRPKSAPFSPAPAATQPTSGKPNAAEENFILAIAKGLNSIPNGMPICVIKIKDSDLWLCYAEDGTMEKVSTNEIASKIESVKDEKNSKITSKDINALFRLYKEKYAVSLEQVEEKPVEEDTDVVKDDKDGVKGRIPAEKLSQYQKNIETSFLEKDSDIVVSALAGTGKTSVLKHLASFKNPSEKWLYLVFNKKNQLESEKEFPEGVTVLTSHSFLGKLLKQVSSSDLPKSEIKTSFDRTGAMVDDSLELSKIIPRNYSVDRVKFPNGRVYYNAKVALKKIVDMCKANSVDPNAKDLKDQIMAVIKQYDIDTDIQNKDKNGNPTGRPMVVTNELIQEASAILRESLPGAKLDRYGKVPWSNGTGVSNNSKRYEGFMNFDDVLWYTSIYKNLINWPSFDVVLADEVQDFNKCQQIMLENLKMAGAKIVAVGDRNQSIYAFRGADSNSFSKVQDNIVGTGGSVHELPVNYRCGKSIIDFVNNNELSPVKNLQSGVNYDGEVLENQPHDDVLLSLIKEYKKGNGKFTMPTALIARNNGILQKTALTLITEDIDFEFIGNDMSRKLLDLCNEVTGVGRMSKNLDMQNFEQKLDRDVSDFLYKYEDTIRMRDKVKEKQEIHKALSHIIKKLTVYDNKTGNVSYFDKEKNIKIRTSSDFVEYLKNKFKGLNFESESDSEIERIKKFQERDPHEYVALCSAHRSKGLEFDRVYVLGKDQFPSKLAKTQKEIEQERNAWYVTLTRAKKQLHLPLPPPKEQDDDDSGW